MNVRTTIHASADSAPSAFAACGITAAAALVGARRTSRPELVTCPACLARTAPAERYEANPFVEHRRAGRLIGGFFVANVTIRPTGESVQNRRGSSAWIGGFEVRSPNARGRTRRR